MRVKTVHFVLLVILNLTSCTPAGTQALTTQAPLVPISTLNLIPSFEDPTLASTSAESFTAHGPWLVYRHNGLFPGLADVPAIPEEFVLLDPAGSDSISITLPDCRDQVSAFLLEAGGSTNYMADIDGDIYLFRPSRAAGLLVYNQAWYNRCNTYFRSGENGGLLIGFHQASPEISPEMMIFELPGGNVRTRFPLVRCAPAATVCDEYRTSWPDMMRQQPRWSPDGRYLAFAAVLDSSSSDLFLYDLQEGGLSGLAQGPGWVGLFEWSPDGNHIILQELSVEHGFPSFPYMSPPSSVLSISLHTKQRQLLYSTEESDALQNLLWWLDDRHFTAYEGSLVNADQARDLRLVDMETGTDQVLFDGDFVTATLDPVHQVFALYALDSEKYPQGIYLVSVHNQTIRFLEGSEQLRDFPVWGETTSLFVSEDICPNDPNGQQAFDYQGNFQCVSGPAPQPAPGGYASPDGKWMLSLNDGLWLEAQGQAAVLVSPETAAHVTWCPDSSCFFFSVLQPDYTQTLYNVSTHELEVKMVDEGIASTSRYQWLGNP